MLIAVNEIIMDTLEFARKYQRRHANVVRRILEILKKEKEFTGNFIEDTYIGAGRVLLKFNITEDGINKLLNNIRDGRSFYAKEKKNKRIEESEQNRANKLIKEKLKTENRIKQIKETKTEKEEKSELKRRKSDSKPIFSKLEIGYIEDLIIEKILSRHSENNLNVTKENVKNKDYSLFTIAERLFGTWENTIKLCGLDYDEIKKNDNNFLVYYAYKFENLTRQILENIHKKTILKGFTKELQPDYLINDGCWADAKLSEWTIYKCETIKKYEPYCDTLTIIYLRGDKNRDEYITEKTRLVSIYKIIDDLPNKTKSSYKRQLDKLWKQIDDKEFEGVEIEGDPNNPKKYKGVRWVRGRWISRIKYNGKIHYLGNFTSESKAAEAYDAFVYLNDLDRETNFGEKARDNTKPKKNHNYIGIWLNKDPNRKWNTWVAGITVKGKKITIGYFKTPELAAKAYDDYVISHELDRKINNIVIT